MKRILSLLLAFTLVFATALSCIPAAFAASAMVTSDAGVDFIKQYEGFCKYPVWDYGQYSVGYGTRCPDDKLEEYRENGISEEDAIALLREHLVGAESAVNSRIIDRYGLSLSQNQFDALVSFTFNCGSGWTYSTAGVFHQAIAHGAVGNDLVRAFALWCSAGGSILKPLLNRRLAEANMYLNGSYSKTPPASYCYVLYDANGGETDPRSQGYSTQWSAEVVPVPTYPGHTFEGWYTQRTGGTKVTSLDASHKGKTLYAHWSGEGTQNPETQPETQPETKPAEPQEIVSGEDITPVEVTVTARDVNVRRGPGLSYNRIGSADKGNKITITQIKKADGYTWGRFSDGWISLSYTDYGKKDEAEKPTEPKPTEPKPTEPKPTEPKPTAPKPTEPKPTEPKPTVPKPAAPKQPKPTEPKNEAAEPSEDVDVLSIARESGSTWIGLLTGETDPEVRTGPGEAFEVSGSMTVDTVVEFIDVRPGWAETAEGWISTRNIEILSVPAASDEIPEDAWVGQVYDCNQLSIRTEPGMESEIAACVNNGAVLTLTEISSVNGESWGKTADGWVSLKYVRMLRVPKSASEAHPDAWIAQVINRRASVVYSEADQTSAYVECLSAGNIVEVLEMRSVEGKAWARLPVGWIALENLELITVPAEPDAEPDFEIVTVQETAIQVYSDADTDSETVGVKGQNKLLVVYETVNAEGTRWGRIQQGWIPMGEEE